jgi:HEAT repeat protein
MNRYAVMPLALRTRRSTAGWALVLVLICAAGGTAAATDDRCRDLLQQALDAKDPMTRKRAVEALSLVAGQFIPQLEGMLQDKDIDVRLATVASLAEAKGQRAAVALRGALDDEVPEVGFAAAKALWSVHDAAGKEALLAILAGDNQTSSGFFSKQKRDALRVLHTPRVMLQFAMAKGIGLVPVPGLGFGLESMRALLTDSGVSGRAAAALMLATERDQASLDALRAALKDTDWSVRAAAVQALALRRDPRLKADVAPLFDDENEAVRLRAAAACLRPAGAQARAARSAAVP